MLNKRRWMTGLLCLGLAAGGCDAVPDVLRESLRDTAQKAVELAVQKAIDEFVEDRFGDALDGDGFMPSDLDLDASGEEDSEPESGLGE